MTQSYHRIVDEEDGGLLPLREIGITLEGDYVECIEQLYGMIWFLADENISDKILKDRWVHREHYVKIAQDRYKDGLKLSPTERYQPFNEGEYEGQPINEILYDFAVTRGDMKDPQTRVFLTNLIENRIKKAKDGE